MTNPFTDPSEYGHRNAPGQGVGRLIPWFVLGLAVFLLIRSWRGQAVDRETDRRPTRGDARSVQPAVDRSVGRGIPNSQVVFSKQPSQDRRSLRGHEVTPAGKLSSEEEATIGLFRTNSASVVYIETTTAASSHRLNLDVTEIPVGAGSGFVWDRKGHVVTNFHVIEGVIRNGHGINVIFADQTSRPAQVVGGDRSKDLAVLKVDAAPDELIPIKVGTSRDLQVGQSVFAIGNPFGLDHTLTTGVISGLGREIQAGDGRRITDVIQTDAAINPGNSGGPLLDSSGRLIGVNTAIFSPSGAYAGVGFAIPADTVLQIVPQLVEFGRVVRPVIGIVTAPEAVTKNLVREFHLDSGGVLVLEVAPDGPAAEAGIQPTTVNESREVVLGDMIVAVDDKPVESIDDLIDQLDKHQVGDTTRVTVVRGLGTTNPEKKDFTVTLSELKVESR